jgi:hypothetical protein
MADRGLNAIVFHGFVCAKQKRLSVCIKLQFLVSLRNLKPSRVDDMQLKRSNMRLIT